MSMYKSETFQYFASKVTTELEKKITKPLWMIYHVNVERG